jgi:hypothetical protein
MKAIVIIFLFRGLCFPAMAQVDMHITDTIKSGYKNLPEKKIYSSLFFETQENGKTTY